MIFKIVNVSIDNLEDGSVSTIMVNKNLSLAKTLCAANDNLKSPQEEEKIDHQRIINASEQLHQMVKHQSTIVFRAKVSIILLSMRSKLTLLFMF